jgi:formyltetrahydrofolate hydrolase
LIDGVTLDKLWKGVKLMTVESQRVTSRTDTGPILTNQVKSTPIIWVVGDVFLVV